MSPVAALSHGASGPRGNSMRCCGYGGTHDIGVVIMPHGTTQPWNDAVEKMLEPLKGKYPIEMAYGMGDAQVIQEAVLRLEE